MKQYHNKLVRNLIPKIIEGHKETCDYKILDKNDYKKELLRKLAEEANEALNTVNSTELCQELSDLLEVIEAITTAFNLNKQEIEAIQLKRREERGSFDQRIFLISTDSK